MPPPRPPPAPPVRSVRSTLLLSSRGALKGASLFDDYEHHLKEETRTSLDGLIAGTWIPIGIAVEHYAACDALGLARAQQASLGRTNGERLSGTLLGTLAKLARNAGTTPIMLVEQFPRFWGRIFEGGSLASRVTGPKDVEVTVCASPLLRSAYFRHGLGGTAESILGLVCTRLLVRVKRFGEAEGSATYLVQWV